MTQRKIALSGTTREGTAHRAIPRALELAREQCRRGRGLGVGRDARSLRPPATSRDSRRRGSSPRRPMRTCRGALDAVRWAREGGRPLLGTCGGFQHLLLEFARECGRHRRRRPRRDQSRRVLARRDAAQLLASWRRTGGVHFAPGSLLASAYGAGEATEGYRCNYGFNASYRAGFEAEGLRFTAWDDEGEIRGAELARHPFFAGVLFQPERAAAQGRGPPAGPCLREGGRRLAACEAASRLLAAWTQARRRRPRPRRLRSSRRRRTRGPRRR